MNEEQDAAASSEPTRSRSGDYQVGYKKPPRATRFKPGQSGNPKGRPKHAKNFRTIVSETMSERVSVRTSKGERRLSRAEVLVMKMVELAGKGNLKAIQQLFVWFQQATPDSPAAEPEQDLALTPADELTLAAFRELVAADLSNSVHLDGERA